MISRNSILALISLLIISCDNKKEHQQETLAPAESIQNDTISNSKDYTPSNNSETDNSLSEDEFVVLENESLGELKYGMSFQEVIKSYGTPDKEAEAELWDADGEYHQKVEYLKEGILLDVIGNPGGQKTINMITLTRPSKLKTLKNIGIGSSHIEIEEAYKDQIAADFSNDESVVVGSIYGGLIFYLKDNTVEAIFMGAAAE